MLVLIRTLIKWYDNGKKIYFPFLDDGNPFWCDRKMTQKMVKIANLFGMTITTVYHHNFHDDYKINYCFGLHDPNF